MSLENLVTEVSPRLLNYETSPGKAHCGVKIIQKVLEAHGLDTKKDPYAYYPKEGWEGFLYRTILRGSMLLSTFTDILVRHDLPVTVHNLETQTEDARLEFLRDVLSRGKRLILLIALSDFGPHWITVEGHDKEGFFIYDSRPDGWPGMLPIGNRYVSNELLLIKWDTACLLRLCRLRSMYGRIALIVEGPRK